MSKPEWGIKRICPDCGTRYYDLNKKTPKCPKCGSEFDPEALLRSRRGRSMPLEDLKKSAPEAGEDIEGLDVEEEIAIEEGEDDVLIEDASELGEEDMEDVVEREEDEDR